MKKSILFSTLSVLLLALVAVNLTNLDKEKEAVKEVILEGYIHGAFNELNPEAMEKAFHKDFAIFSADGEKLRKYPIATWVDGVKDRKNSKDFDPSQNKWDYNFATIDITGNSASVKVELFRHGKHVYTDYLSLLKFDSGWKIVAKVYHQHG